MRKARVRNALRRRFAPSARPVLAITLLGAALVAVSHAAGLPEAG